MTKFGVVIGGEDVTLPGVYTYTDTSAMVAPAGTVGRALAIVGTGRGGNVGRLTRLSSIQQVTRVLRSGDLAQIARMAFQRGVREVVISRVGQATPATLDIGTLLLADRNPGIGGRSLQSTIVGSSVYPALTTGDTPVPAVLDVSVRDTYTQVTEVYRSVGAVLEVSAPASAVGASVKVESTDGAVTVTLSPGGGGADVVLDGSVLKTAKVLADAIANLASWGAKLITRDVNVPVTALRTGTFPLVAGKALVTGKHRECIARALEGSELVQATERPSGGRTEEAKLLPEWTFFEGGSEGAVPTVLDWSNALTLVNDADVAGIVVATGNLAVQTLAESDARRLSSITGRRERRVWTGPGLSGSKAEMKEDARLTAETLNSEYLTVAANEIYDTDIVTGELQRYPSYFLGAYAAASKLAGRPADSNTDRRLQVAKLGYVMDDADCTELIEAGVLCARFDDEVKANIIVEGLTSYTTDNNMVLRKETGMDMKLYLQRRVRQAVRGRRVVGAPGSETQIRDVLRIVEGVFRSEVRHPITNPNGILTGGVDPITRQARQPFENVSVEMNGFDLVNVDAELHFVNEIGKVAIRLAITPVMLTAGAARAAAGRAGGTGGNALNTAGADADLAAAYQAATN